MSDNRIMYLQGMLEHLETSQLDEMLRAELQKEQPDAHAVQMILAVLEEREKDYPVEIDPGIEQAWQEYIGKTAVVSKRSRSSLLLKVASFAVILAILFVTMPQRVEAESIWERLIRWTDSVFELFSPDDRSEEPVEYVFQTDNPGLQQVYDVVVELGVTDPVVPMWLPEGYELISCQTTETPVKSYTYATFALGNRRMGFTVDKYFQNTSNEYYKNDSDVKIIEIEGVVHNIMQNDDVWVAVWAKSNVECSICIDCQEDVFYKILQSIYSEEEN